MADDEETRIATTLNAFEDAADLFGGDLAAWPDALREGAEALLAAGETEATAAQAILTRARRLDALLAAEAEAAPALSTALGARLMQDAEAALSERLAERAAAGPAPAAPQPAKEVGVWERLKASAANLLDRWEIGGVAAAAAAGLALGLVNPIDLAPPTAPPAADELALFEPFTDDGAESGDLFADPGPQDG